MEEETTDVVEVKVKTPGPKVPWQSIIVLLFGAVIVIYAAVAPNVQTTRRVFSVVMMLLWSILWALVLWLTWKDGKEVSAWLLMIIPITLMIIYFVLILIMNIDSEL